jgi:hypothetical protein
MTPQEFEEKTGLRPTQAARILGIAYPRWCELKRGARKVKPYHEASMIAHAMLPEGVLMWRLLESTVRSGS